MISCFAFADLGFLWLNAIGCAVVVLVALGATALGGPRKAGSPA